MSFIQTNPAETQSPSPSPFVAFLQPAVNPESQALSANEFVAWPASSDDVSEVSFSFEPCKRALDIFLALLFLMATSPLFLILCVIIPLNSRGSPFYKQLRKGRKGIPFWIYKFRSMHRDTHRYQAKFSHFNEFDGMLFKVSYDPRVTPLGRWLRHYHIDELPQLWNVLYRFQKIAAG